MSLEHMPANPEYGFGAYRRRLRFVARPSRVLATLDDTHHAMWLAIDHRDGTITGVQGAFNRQPATPCGGALAPLSALIGLELDASGQTISERIPPAQNCTHLGDLARWSLAVARQGPDAKATYDIVIPDSRHAPAWIEIARDGVRLHHWLVRDQHIVAPEAFAGRPLMRGFAAWARTAFDPEEFAAALMLQRGVFVARARPYLVDQAPAMPLRAARDMEGACFSYSDANWRSGESMTGFVRDFTRHLTPQTLPTAIADAFELEPDA